MSQHILDIQNNVRVVTTNSFITAKGLENLSLKATKLLLIAIAQCRIGDSQFFTFQITIPAFAEYMGIHPSNVYREAFGICDELFKAYIYKRDDDHAKFRMCNLFDVCEYDSSIGLINFRLAPAMAEFFLQVRKDFTKPLLSDFRHMNSTYAVKVWMLCQEKMKSKFPGITQVMEFDLSVDEIRAATGTSDAYQKVIDLKINVLERAFKQILLCCGVDITYSNLKQGRRVVGFHCVAKSVYHMEISDVSDETVVKIRQIEERIRERRK